jgi:hypothetical protein
LGSCSIFRMVILKLMILNLMRLNISGSSLVSSFLFYFKIIETAFNASFRVRMMTISRMGVLGPCFLLRSKSSMILTLIHNLIFSFVVVLNYWLCLKFGIVPLWETLLSSLFFSFFKCHSTDEYPHTNSVLIRLTDDTFFQEH